MLRYEQLISTPTPNESKPALEKIEGKFGFVPNVLSGIARSPGLLKSYLALSGAFEESSLSAEEQQIVLLTASRANECGYCTSVHSLAAEATDLSWDTIEKIRNREPVADERHEALRVFTERVVLEGGTVPVDAWTAFTSAGFDHRHALDVVLGVTLKTLTNTINHLVDTPLDDAFQKRAWSPGEARAAHA